ncbi:MAG: hypothetical protein KDB03_02725 [Planctomycetales bacterium]|nr:hypothetical protein [Planctomycetales bacterium]
MPTRSAEMPDDFVGSSRLQPNQFLRTKIGWLLLALLIPIHSVSAQIVGDKAPKSLIFQALTRSTNSRLEPGRCLNLRAHVINNQDVEDEGVLVAKVEGFPEIESAYRVQLRPHEQEFVDLQVQIPEGVTGRSMIEITVVMMVRSGGREVILDRHGIPTSHSLKLQVSRLEGMPAVVMEDEEEDYPDWQWPKKVKDLSYELAMAARIDSGAPRDAAIYDSLPMPTSPLDWESIDTLIISKPDAFSDAAAVESIRKFLDRGGRMWVMLNQVPTETLRPFLGAGQFCETIDTVELANFIVNVHDASNYISQDDLSAEFHHPAVMKRVIQTGGVVTHDIDGWPVAIWMPAGEGEILLTTLDSRAWMTVRERQTSADLRFQSFYTTRLWANNMAARINFVKSDSSLDAMKIEYPMKQIGNPIVPRTWVAAALIGFCIVLMCASVWQAIHWDLSRMAVWAPILALLASGILLGASTWVRKDLEESDSRLQLVNVTADGQNAMIQESGVVFISDARSMELASETEGRGQADESLNSGIRRFEIQDLHRWTLSNQSWQPGTWRYKSRYSIPQHNLTALGEFSSQGVKISAPADLPSPLEDPVVAYVAGDPLIPSVSANQLLADGSLSGRGDRWVSSSIITDEQQRRSEVYRDVFSPRERIASPRRRVYGWTERWSGTEWTYDLAHLGSSLVSLPLKLQRPPLHTEILVPHGFVDVHASTNAVGKSYAYDDLHGKWVDEASMASDTTLNFWLPPEVTPFRASEIEIELDIKAPDRQVKLLCPCQEPAVVIAEFEAPSVPWKKVIEDPVILADALDGNLQLQVVISERLSGQTGNVMTTVVNWQINRLHVSFRGQVEPRVEISANN